MLDRIEAPVDGSTALALVPQPLDVHPPASARLAGALRAMAVDLAAARRSIAELSDTNQQLRAEVEQLTRSKDKLAQDNELLRRENGARHGPFAASPGSSWLGNVAGWRG